jgi:hypothetical protein
MPILLRDSEALFVSKNTILSALLTTSFAFLVSAISIDFLAFDSRLLIIELNVSFGVSDFKHFFIIRGPQLTMFA